MKTPTEKLDEWQAICDAATEGPWETCTLEMDGDPGEAYRKYLSYGQGDVAGVWCPGHIHTRGKHPRPEHAVLACQTGNGPRSSDNSKFISSARTAMPELIAMVRGLMEAVTCDSRCPALIGSWYCSKCGERRARSDGMGRCLECKTGLVLDQGYCDCTRPQWIADAMKTREDGIDESKHV